MTFQLIYVHTKKKLNVEFINTKKNYFCTKNHCGYGIPDGRKKIITNFNVDADMLPLKEFCANVICAIWYDNISYTIIFEQNHKNIILCKNLQRNLNMVITEELVKSLGALVHYNNCHKFIIGATSHRFLHLINMHPCNAGCFCVTGSVDNDGQEIERFNNWYETSYTYSIHV